jgi:hypothetical protein
MGDFSLVGNCTSEWVPADISPHFGVYSKRQSYTTAGIV